MRIHFPQLRRSKDMSRSTTDRVDEIAEQLPTLKSG
jgi:hypothetical protein